MRDLLKDKLEILADDELMLEAIEAVLLEKIATVAPQTEKTDDDRILGQKFRAYITAVRLTEEVLRGLKSYKIQRSNNNQENKGK